VQYGKRFWGEILLCSGLWERKVLLLVAAGMPNKRIAAHLGVCLQTVELHRGRLMRKLQLHSVAELVRWAEKAWSFLPSL
jgi:FixJ family two-component response regulator